MLHFWRVYIVGKGGSVYMCVGVGGWGGGVADISLSLSMYVSALKIYEGTMNCCKDTL